MRIRLLPRKTILVRAGKPVDLSAFEGKPITNELLHEATEVIMHAVADTLGELRGETPPEGTLRPAQGPVPTSRHDGRGRRHDEGCGVRCRILGYGVRHGAGRTRGTRCPSGAGGSRSARRSTPSTRTPTTCPGLRLPDAITATHDPAAAADGAEAVVLAVPSQSLRDNLKDWAGVLPNAVPLVSLMKGVEVGTTKRMSEVIAELDRCRPGADRGRVGSEPGARDRRGTAGRVGGRVCGRGHRDPVAEVVPLADVPPVHEQRRDRLRARRRDART